MIIRAFILSRIGLFIFGIAASLLFPPNPNGNISQQISSPLLRFWYSLAQWDGGNFISISTSGYTKEIEYVFFPLYPLLIKYLTIFMKNPIFAGLVISNISFMLFLITFNKYLKKNFTEKIATSTILTYIFFPTSFFTSAVYSESLFLVFLIAFLVFLDKKKYIYAAFFAFLSQLVRFAGIFMLAAYIAKVLKEKRNIKEIIKSFLFSPVFVIGILIYSIFLKNKHSDPFLYLNAQTAWLRFPQDPISTILDYLFRLITLQKMPLNDIFDLTLTIIFLVLLIVKVNKLQAAIWVFSILAILIPASTGTLTSMPRYVLVSLGGFIAAAMILEKKQALKIPVWSLMLFLQIILFSLFINGYWIA